MTTQVSYGPTNTYKALRLISKIYNLYYSVWCTNEHELYDLNVRPLPFPRIILLKNQERPPPNQQYLPFLDPPFPNSNTTSSTYSSHTISEMR